MNSLVDPLKRGWLVVSTKPAFSVMIIGMLALGIAGNAAVFSIFNSLFLRPLPFAESERVVDLDETKPQWNLVHVGVSNPDLSRWRTQVPTFRFVRLGGFFGGLAALLVATGLYGTLAHRTNRRTTEIGMRMALGAQRGQVLRLIIRESLLISAIGVAAGLPLALACSRLLDSMLYKLSPFDPLSFGCWRCARSRSWEVSRPSSPRRAARVDPMVALRYE